MSCVDIMCGMQQVDDVIVDEDGFALKWEVVWFQPKNRENVSRGFQELKNCKEDFDIEPETLVAHVGKLNRDGTIPMRAVKNAMNVARRALIALRNGGVGCAACTEELEEVEFVECVCCDKQYHLPCAVAQGYDSNSWWCEDCQRQSGL